MTENKVLELEFGARSEATGKLTEQQSECLDHEIQTNPQPTESQKIRRNLGLRKPHRAKPTRDARGRWLNGHCPNPKGRPRKKPKDYPDLSDIRTFGNTLIEVRTNGGMELMDRRAALLHKMFEDAMRGKVSMQRVLYSEFERNDERLAAARLRYQQLMTKWVIENDNFDGLDGENIPFDVQLEIAGLESLLSHYFPGQYPRRRWRGGDDDTD